MCARLFLPSMERNFMNKLILDVFVFKGQFYENCQEYVWIITPKINK